MKDKTFTDFLNEWHARDYHGTDDDMPDAFDGWLENLQIDTLISMADIFARENYLRGFKVATDVALEAIKEVKL